MLLIFPKDPSHVQFKQKVRDSANIRARTSIYLEISINYSNTTARYQRRMRLRIRLKKKSHWSRLGHDDKIHRHRPIPPLIHLSSFCNSSHHIPNMSASSQLIKTPDQRDKRDMQTKAGAVPQKSNVDECKSDNRRNNTKQRQQTSTS